jgi:hypothetical protein
LHEVVGLTVLSPDRPIKSKARVVWSRSEFPQGAGEDMPRGMGVEFIKISNEDRVFISSFISDLDFVVYLQSAAADEDEHRLLEVKLVGNRKKKKTTITMPKSYPIKNIPKATNVCPGLQTKTIFSVGTAIHGIILLSMLVYRMVIPQVVLIQRANFFG